MTPIWRRSAGFATHRRARGGNDEIPQDMAIPSHRWPGVPWEHRMSHGHKAVMGSSGDYAPKGGVLMTDLASVRRERPIIFTDTGAGLKLGANPARI